MLLRSRLRLLSLLSAAVLACLATGLGGLFLHHQHTDNALLRAQVAARALAERSGWLMNLGLGQQDFIGFESQCNTVVAADPLLTAAAVVDLQGRVHTNRTAQPQHWPDAVLHPTPPPPSRLDGPEGPLVTEPVWDTHRQPLGHVVVAINGAALRQATQRSVAQLALWVSGVLGLGLLVQLLLWRAMGRMWMAQALPDASSAPTSPTPSPPDAEHLAAADQARLAQLMGSRIEELTRTNAELALDIERHRAREQELRALAHTDALTGLANRAFVLPHARYRLAQAQRERKTMGLMLLDFDRFKLINDHHGHAVGDEVLRIMARRLQATCREADLLARLGGDEFLLVFEGVRNREEVIGLGARLVAQFHLPVEPAQGLRLEVGVSIGAALFPDHGTDIDTLLAAADAAMYEIKQGGGGFAFASTPVRAPAPAQA